ncbi:hypothetical protein ACM9HF_20570 [Colwellia sp. RE-S-Sl-9]
MKLKPLLLTTLISSTILTAPLAAIASEANLKVAVIKDATDSESILNGEYKEAIANLSSKNQDFEESTTLCVAYLKSNNEEMSETACTAAIRSAKKLDTNSKKMRYLQSISYNNRAVARYLKDDMVGAMSDLAFAKSLDSNPLVKENLSLISSKVELSDDTSYSTYAD